MLFVGLAVYAYNAHPDPNNGLTSSFWGERLGPSFLGRFSRTGSRIAKAGTIISHRAAPLWSMWPKSPPAPVKAKRRYTPHTLAGKCGDDLADELEHIHKTPKSPKTDAARVRAANEKFYVCKDTLNTFR